MEDEVAAPPPCPICGPVASAYGPLCSPCRSTPRHLPTAARTRIIHHLNQFLSLCDANMMCWSDWVNRAEEDGGRVRDIEAERQKADMMDLENYMESIILTKSILRTTWVFRLGVYAPGPYGSLFLNRRVAICTLLDIYVRCASE